jgi:Holliday junction resolvase RusA-like endonuclease
MLKLYLFSYRVKCNSHPFFSQIKFFCCSSTKETVAMDAMDGVGDQIQVGTITRLFQTNHRVRINPVAQARHRMRGGRMYDPSSRQKALFRLYVQAYLRLKYGITNEMMPLTTNFVSVSLTFLIPRPSSHFVGSNRNGPLREEFESSMPTTSGDIDNYIKFFLDAIDGIFYSNDRNVIQITAIKLYCNETCGRTIFRIVPFEITTISIDN